MALRTYENFMAMSKMEMGAASADKEEIHRYGITLRTTLALNDLAEVDRFFYCYYKVSVD
jgi:hypothetical protein